MLLVLEYVVLVAVLALLGFLAVVSLGPRAVYDAIVRTADRLWPWSRHSYRSHRDDR